MINTRSIKIAVITAGLASTPMLSVAANSPLAMDSCVKAFMVKLNSTMAKKPKLQNTRYINNGVGQSSSELTLTARDAHDNHAIARAVCTVNTSGQVIALHQEPLEGLGLL
jgi:hypothetical protein